MKQQIGLLGAKVVVDITPDTNVKEFKKQIKRRLEIVINNMQGKVMLEHLKKKSQPQFLGEGIYIRYEAR